MSSWPTLCMVTFAHGLKVHCNSRGQCYSISANSGNNDGQTDYFTPWACRWGNNTVDAEVMNTTVAGSTCTLE